MTGLNQLGHQPKTEMRLGKERSSSSENPRKINGKTEGTQLEGMHRE